MLQQSPLQLQLGLAADAPIDLRGWGYGDPRNDAGDNWHHFADLSRSKIEAGTQIQIKFKFKITTN